MENKIAVTETPAELEQVIKRILDMDDKAKRITGKAKEQQLEKERSIVKEKAALREQYLQQAKEKIEQLRITEEQLADTAIEEAGAQFDQQLAALEAAYEAGKAQWVEEIYRQTLTR